MTNQEEVETLSTPIKKSRIKDAVKKEVNETESVIYIGPSLKGVTSGTVFQNGILPALKEAINAVPAIASLVVPLRSIVNANQELAVPDSALSRFYQLATEYRKGE